MRAFRASRPRARTKSTALRKPTGHDGWDQRLARRLVFYDGRKLTTLREAADVVLNLRSVRDYSVSDLAIEVLSEAERSGRRADLEAATKLVALALRHDNLLVEEVTTTRRGDG